jgi:hypothetical protein
VIDRNGAAVTLGARVRFTTDHQRERWVEGWVRDVAEHTFYHPKTTRWEARVDNGVEDSDHYTNGATILAWVPCAEIEVCGEHRREEEE